MMGHPHIPRARPSRGVQPWDYARQKALQVERIDVPEVIWWGRFDPGYSRNRIVLKSFADLGWTIRQFRPAVAAVADWEARIRRLPRPNLVWVPCFRQRDLPAASRWARTHGVPLIFDPLISAYDKQVDERRKLSPSDFRARRLKAWESSLFQRADRIIADTPAHAKYFREVLGVAEEKIQVIYVGAEAALFNPVPPLSGDRRVEVLFYGSFIPLQGPEVVVEAARRYQGPPARWVLLGQGPLRSTCEAQAKGVANITFEDWVPYAQLPARIHQADILLGIFGTTPKANRVIPNKVFQSLACGRVVVTRSADAYSAALCEKRDSGLVWVPAGTAQSLAEAVAALASDRGKLSQLSKAATTTSQQHFSENIVRMQLHDTLRGLVAHE